MKKLSSIVLLFALSLSADIQSTTPSLEEIVRATKSEAWKIEFDSKELLEIKVAFFLKDKKFDSSVSGSSRGHNDGARKSACLVISRRGDVDMEFSEGEPYGGAGGILSDRFVDEFFKMERIELPETLEIGVEYPIMKSKISSSEVLFSISMKPIEDKMPADNR